MTCLPTALPGVLRVQRPVWRDGRGALTEVANLAADGIPGFHHAAQVNLARSAPGVLRGLHWQARRPQGKLVGAVVGRVLDVVADVRPDSPTFGRHVAVWLEAESEQLWVPPGYAHGFYVPHDLGHDALVLYVMDAPYDGADQHGVRWDDADLAVPWGTSAPVLSAKDAALPSLAELRARGGLPGAGA